VLESEITSPDGRVLAYTELGSPQGPVVVHCHGAPSSRLELTYFDEAFAERGVRVVTIDRPGYGGSSSRPGRRVADWPADAAAVADELGVDRFAVTGLSSGGAYVVATAALLPDRVAGAAVISGVTDFSWPEAWNGFLGDEARLMRMGDEEQISAWCRDRYGADGMGFLDEGLDDLAPADVAMFENEALAGSMAGSVATAFRKGFDGYAQDVSAQARPWSFDPGQITAPVLVVHGEADTLVPLAHAHHNTELVPTARLVTRPGQGHLSLLLEIPQLADELVGQLRRP
jgi:pimeloyl-ACP methyl ester carboxylesterase